MTLFHTKRYGSKFYNKNREKTAALIYRLWSVKVVFWKGYFFLALTYAPFGWFGWVPWSLQRRYIPQNGPQLEIKLPIKDRPRARKCMQNVNVLGWRDNIRDRSGQLLDPPFPRNTHFYYFHNSKKPNCWTEHKSEFEGYPQKSFTGNTSVFMMTIPQKGGVGTPPHFALNEGTGKVGRLNVPTGTLKYRYWVICVWLDWQSQTL